MLDDVSLDEGSPDGWMEGNVTIYPHYKDGEYNTSALRSECRLEQSLIVDPIQYYVLTFYYIH